MVKRFWSATQAIPRTVSQPGYHHYLTPLRKVIIDYDPYAHHQEGIRNWLRKPFLTVARENPDVEFLVRPLPKGKSSVIRGHYNADIAATGRDKVICVDKLDLQNVDKKMNILLNSSGRKIQHLKNNQLEAGPGGESARGIWSILHDHAKPTGGYII